MPLVVAILLVLFSLAVGVLTYLVFRIVGVKVFRRAWTILPLSLATLVAISGYMTSSYECPFSEVELAGSDFAKIVSDDATEIEKRLPGALGFQERRRLTEPLTVSDVSITRVYNESPLHWWQTDDQREMTKYSIMIGIEADPTLMLLGVNKCGAVITREIDF